MNYFETAFFVASQMTAECSAGSKVETANHPLLQVTFPENVVCFFKRSLTAGVDFAVCLICMDNLSEQVASGLGTEASDSQSLDGSVTF